MVGYHLRIWVYKELFHLSIISFPSILLGSMTIIRITCQEWEILAVRPTYQVWKHIPWLDNIMWSANVLTCCRWVRKQLRYQQTGSDFTGTAAHRLPVRVLSDPCVTNNVKCNTISRRSTFQWCAMQQQTTSEKRDYMCHSWSRAEINTETKQGKEQLSIFQHGEQCWNKCTIIIPFCIKTYTLENAWRMNPNTKLKKYTHILPKTVK